MTLVAHSTGTQLHAITQPLTPVVGDEVAFAELETKHAANVQLIRTLGPDYLDDVAALTVENQLLMTAMRAMARKYTTQVAGRN